MNFKRKRLNFLNYIIKSGDNPGEVFFKNILIFINYVIKVMHKDHLYKIKNVSVKVSIMAILVINFVYQKLLIILLRSVFLYKKHHVIIQTGFNRILKDYWCINYLLALVQL